jgi:CRISPR/Cas system CMR-associated protein Cmr3 (group 5 of RAMP superfamily)
MEETLLEKTRLLQEMQNSMFFKKKKNFSFLKHIMRLVLPPQQISEKHIRL